MMVKNTKRIFVLNPTNQNYKFEWEPIDEDNAVNKLFRYISPKEVIYSGKKFEMVFEYTPIALGVYESYWYFKINSEKMFINSY